MVHGLTLEMELSFPKRTLLLSQVVLLALITISTLCNSSALVHYNAINISTLGSILSGDLSLLSGP